MKETSSWGGDWFEAEASSAPPSFSSPAAPGGFAPLQSGHDGGDDVSALTGSVGWQEDRPVGGERMVGSEGGGFGGGGSDGGGFDSGGGGGGGADGELGGGTRTTSRVAFEASGSGRARRGTKAATPSAADFSVAALGAEGQVRVELFHMGSSINSTCRGLIGKKGSHKFCVKPMTEGLGHCGTQTHTTKTSHARVNCLFVRTTRANQVYGLYYCPIQCYETELDELEGRKETVVDWVTEFKERYTQWGRQQVRARSQASPKDGKRLFVTQRAQAASNLLPNPSTPHPKVAFGEPGVGKMDTLDEGESMWTTDRFGTANIAFPEGLESDIPDLTESAPLEALVLEFNGLRKIVSDLAGATRQLDQKVARDISEVVRGAALLELNSAATDRKVVRVGSLLGPKPQDIFDADVVTVWDGVVEAHGAAVEAERRAAEASKGAKTAQAMMSAKAGAETRMEDLEKRASKFQKDYNDFLEQGVKKYIGPAAGKVWRELFPRGRASVIERIDAIEGKVTGLAANGPATILDPYGVGMGSSAQPSAPAGSVILTQREWTTMQDEMQKMRDRQLQMEAELGNMRKLGGVGTGPVATGSGLAGSAGDRIARLEGGLAELRTKVESESIVIAGQKFDGFDDCPTFVRSELGCQVHLIFDVISFNHATRKEFVDELTHVTETDKYARAKYKNRNEAVITAACKTTVPHPYAKKTDREDPATPLSGLPSAVDFGYQLADGRHHVILEAMGRLHEEINADLNATLGMTAKGELVLRELISGASRHAEYFLNVLGLNYVNFCQLAPGEDKKNWKLACKILYTIMLDIKKLKAGGSAVSVPAAMEPHERVMYVARIFWGAIRTHHYMEGLIRQTIKKSTPYRNALLDQMVDSFMGVSGFKEVKERVAKVENKVNSLEQKSKAKKG